MAKGSSPVGGLIGILRSPVVRIGFLILALGLCGWALVTYWGPFTQALVGMSPGPVILALGFTLIHVFLMMCSWRVILGGLGSRLRLSDGTSMFGMGQIGKYIPGGIWNVLASAELGADRNIPRRASVAAMGVATMLNVLTALAVGCLTFLYAPGPLLQGWGWLIWVMIPLLICLFPPVLNRLIGLAFRLLRQPAPPQKLSYASLGMATGLSILGWLAAGLQMWLLASDLGLPLTSANVVMCIGVSALAWAAGLLFIPAPAGVGVREAVTLAALTGTLPQGALLALVLLSRVLMVIADLTFALVGVTIWRMRKRTGEPAS